MRGTDRQETEIILRHKIVRNVIWAQLWCSNALQHPFNCHQETRSLLLWHAIHYIDHRPANFMWWMTSFSESKEVQEFQAASMLGTPEVFDLVNWMNSVKSWFFRISGMRTNVRVPDWFWRARILLDASGFQNPQMTACILQIFGLQILNLRSSATRFANSKF